MEKKVDLTENNKTSTIRLKSNKSISLTINIQKRPPRDLSTDSQFKINRGRIHRLTQYNNYTNEIPNEEDDEIPEDYFDDEETNDGSDGENSISDDLKDIFDEVLSDLKDNEKKVIYYRFLFGDKLKFREIGEILCFTKQAAHIHYTKALTKIRDNKEERECMEKR